MLAILAVLSLLAPASAEVLTVDPAASLVRYRVNHKLHKVEGLSRSVEGKALLEPDGSVRAMVRVPVQSFDSGDANRDAHMLETLEAGRHPHVVFKGVTSLDRAGAGRKAVEARLRGELEFHGVKHPVEVPVTVEFGGGGARVRGKLTVSLEAHRIERPSLLLVKVDDACAIELDLHLKGSGP